MKPGSDRCQICQAPTQGIFNKATKLIKKLKAVESLKNATNSSSASSSGRVSISKMFTLDGSGSTKAKSKWVNDP